MSAWGRRLQIDGQQAAAASLAPAAPPRPSRPAPPKQAGLPASRPLSGPCRNADSAGNHSFGTSGSALDGILTSLAPSLEDLEISHCSSIFHAASLPSLRSLTALQSFSLQGITYPLTSADLEPLASLPNLDVRCRVLRLCSRAGLHAKTVADAAHPPALRESLQLTSAEPRPHVDTVPLHRCQRVGAAQRGARQPPADRVSRGAAEALGAHFPTAEQQGCVAPGTASGNGAGPSSGVDYWRPWPAQPWHLRQPCICLTASRRACCRSGVSAAQSHPPEGPAMARRRGLRAGGVAQGADQPPGPEEAESVRQSLGHRDAAVLGHPGQDDGALLSEPEVRREKGWVGRCRQRDRPATTQGSPLCAPAVAPA